MSVDSGYHNFHVPTLLQVLEVCLVTKQQQKNHKECISTTLMKTSGR